MRRKDVERLLRDKDRVIQYLQVQNEKLTDKLMVLAGEPNYGPPPELVDAPEPELPSYTWTPEQELDADPVA